MVGAIAGMSRAAEDGASMRRIRISVGIVVILGAGLAGADEPRLAESYGFKPLEIYKLDPRITGVLAKDVDGDKVDDILVVNNGRSRIELLLSTKGGPGDEPKADTNQVPSDRRMRLKSLPVNKAIVSLATGDFNADGRPDLVYYGTPAELIVVLNEGGGNFGPARRISVGEAVERPTGLAVGDLNRDGKDDIALLAAGEVIAVTQGEGGKLSEPERIPHTAQNPWLLKLLDLDGDGGDDLIVLDTIGEESIRVRFNLEGGKLGPEQRMGAESPRAIAFADLDGRRGVEVLTIEEKSGRAKVLKLDDAEEDDAQRRARLLFFPLPKGNTQGRSIAVGDLDGDKKLDVVATDPAGAQFFVYLQGKEGLGASQAFPGLVGGRTVKLGDLDGDGRAEVVVFSLAEKEIALSRFADGRLGFPAPLPIAGEPVALELGDLDGDGRPEVLYVVRATDKEGTDVYTLKALARDKSGTFFPYRWANEDGVPLKGLNGAPPALRVVDANLDGRADILAFNAYGPPVLLLGRAGEAPVAAAGGVGQLAGAKPEGVGVAAAGLLVSQNTYARVVALDKSGQWTIKDQYNAGRPAATIAGAATLDLDGDGKTEVALYDKVGKNLLFLDKKDGAYRPGGLLHVGAIDFQGLVVGDFDGDGKDDLLLAGTDKFGVVLGSKRGQRLKTLATYETNRKDGQLTDLIAGDLNGDGQPDVLFSDTAEHFLEIAALKKSNELERALAFKVFEQKSFRNRAPDGEPRDMALGDVDGDGRADIILLVHDRVLVYRQDAGTSKDGDKTAKKE